MFLRVVLLLQLILWNIHLFTEVVKIPDLLDNYLVPLLGVLKRVILLNFEESVGTSWLSSLLAFFC